MTARPARRRAAAPAVRGADGFRRPLAALLALLALLSLALAGGCGEPARAPPVDPWPLSLEEPGLLAYAAFTLPDDLRDAALEKLAGWHPRGLRTGRPLVLVHLDAKTYGGPLALLLPLRDADDFRASLRECAALHDVGSNRYRFDTPRDSPIRILALMISGAMSGGSPLAMLQSLTDAPQASFSFELSEEGAYAILAPSFEAAGACRNTLRVLGGFETAPPHALVASLDLARMHLVYASQIAEAENRLRGLLSGAGTAGALGAIMRGGEGGGMPELPVNWELLWALKEMFAVGHVEAAQLAVDASPRFWELVGALPEHVSQAAGASPGDADMPDDTEPSRDGAEAPDDHEDRPRDDDGPDAAELEDMGKLYRAVGTQSARVRLTPRSSLAEVLAALKPAPEVEGARLVLAADPQTFAPAVAAWCRPIAELVKGRGPPAQRYADEMARLLGAWDGLLAVVPAPDQQLMVFASLAPGRSLEPDAWRAWLEPLLATAHVEGFGGVLVEEVQSDGRHVWRDAGGATALSYGFVDDIVWAATGEKAAPPVAALAAFRAARAVRGGAGAALAPVFRVDVPLDEAGLGLALQVHGDEVQISWQLTERER